MWLFLPGYSIELSSADCAEAVDRSSSHQGGTTGTINFDVSGMTVFLHWGFLYTPISPHFDRAFTLPSFNITPYKEVRLPLVCPEDIVRFTTLSTSGRLYPSRTTQQGFGYCK